MPTCPRNFGRRRDVLSSDAVEARSEEADSALAHIHQLTADLVAALEACIRQLGMRRLRSQDLINEFTRCCRLLGLRVHHRHH